MSALIISLILSISLRNLRKIPRTSFSVVALEKLSAQYPDLLFTLSYEEETGWGGERIYVAGEVVDNSEYGWKCRECDHEEDETPYCEECDYDICPSCGFGEPDEPCEQHKEMQNA